MNLIVIVLDSLRVDHIGCYGGSTATPNIDSLANDGATMAQAYSENMPTQRSLRSDEWTYLHNLTRDPDELYRRDSDTREQNNVIDSHRDTAVELQRALAGMA